jgi:hemerythrin-like domain-containing protein
MAAATTITRDPQAVGAVDPALLARPLDYIVADHERQRHLCRLLDRLADEAALDPRLAAAVAAHLDREMAVHVLDEEEDLFPLLRRRALPEDGIERVLGLLSREHSEDDRLGDAIVAGLRRALGDGTAGLEEVLREDCRAFARRQRRHLAVENALVMPLAETRLTEADRKGLSRRMAVRRGLDPRTGRPA